MRKRKSFIVAYKAGKKQLKTTGSRRRYAKLINYLIYSKDLFLKSAILKNGINYLERAISDYHSNDYKSATINLWSGLLLLFKYKLFLENPVLIYSKITDAIKINKLGYLSSLLIKPQKNMKTVDYDKIIERLIIMGDVDSLILRYHKTFESLRKKRNRIEHFVYDMKQSEFLTIFHEIMPFINNFLEKELNIDPTSIFTNWDEFLDIESFYKERLLENQKFVKEMQVSDRDVAKGGEYIYEDNCPSCTNGIIIEVSSNELYCKTCGFQASFDKCEYCGEIIPDYGWLSYNNELGLCSSCIEHLSDNL